MNNQSIVSGQIASGQIGDFIRCEVLKIHPPLEMCYDLRCDENGAILLVCPCCNSKWGDSLDALLSFLTEWKERAQTRWLPGWLTYPPPLMVIANGVACCVCSPNIVEGNCPVHSSNPLPLLNEFPGSGTIQKEIQTSTPSKWESWRDRSPLL